MGYQLTPVNLLYGREIQCNHVKDTKLKIDWDHSKMEEELNYPATAHLISEYTRTVYEPYFRAAKDKYQNVFVRDLKMYVEEQMKLLENIPLKHWTNHIYRFFGDLMDLRHRLKFHSDNQLFVYIKPYDVHAL